MRKDIAETLREFLMNGIKPNYSKITKQFNCDARKERRCRKGKKKKRKCKSQLKNVDFRQSQNAV